MSTTTTDMKVPIFDSRREYLPHASELLAAAERVLASGQYILGEEVHALEQEIADYLQVRHAVAVASGTDALWLSLKAAGIGPGDRVLTSPLTFFATASAIINAGAEPVFADVTPGTMTLDPENARVALEGRSKVYSRLGISPETVKAIVPVHLFGQTADMPAMGALAQDFGLAIVEDSAQAIGAEYAGHKAGTLGDYGCFSFFPTKNLGGFGDGGLVTTGNDENAETVRLLRGHGSKQKYHHDIVGTNSRMDALQAALLRVKLGHLDDAIAARRAHAAVYDQELQQTSHIEPPLVGPERIHVYHQYAIRVREGARDELKRFLADRGVQSEVHYPVPLHLQGALRPAGYAKGDFPISERICGTILSLPVFPLLTAAERSHVLASLIAAKGEIGA